ncbi:FAD:protein FMN transferase [Candidatus Saccharibacteria bacterium]|nr:FAD:protein FMN transferase [Candidatus Saccharibacteria bacterium]
MRQVQQIMGMPISIEISDCDNESVFKDAFDRLRQIDDKFSTYKTDSEVSRFSKGEITESELSSELKNIIEACREAEVMTDGYFSAWAASAFDPSGYVKGWAITEAGKVIKKAGYKTYCIGAGGDILASSDSEKKWNIGIQDPRDKSKILNLLSISNGAVATSGNYERGTHIINPKTKKPAYELLSVTVTGPDIIRADVLTTALFAMGREKAQEFIKSQPDYSAILV